MEQEKNCGNCKYFIAHYVEIKTLFSKMREGHCINTDISWNVRKKNIPITSCCEKWESDRKLKQEKKESIKKVLKNMRDTLIRIERILSDDL